MSSPLKHERFSLGKAVKTLRNQAGLTQEDLAYKSGVHATWISKVECGKTNPTYATMEKIAAGLGVSHDQILDLAETLRKSQSAE